jgi:hypothetical protein
LARAYAIKFLLGISLDELSAQRFNQLLQRHAISPNLRPNLIQPRLARRPRLPPAVNPQPLVRIAPNP